ncbi:hypothetical protein B0A49_13669, partial [Neofusicoccum parvum]
PRMNRLLMPMATSLYALTVSSWPKSILLSFFIASLMRSVVHLFSPASAGHM